MQAQEPAGSGGNDQLFTVIQSDQGHMRKIQARIVARLVQLLGMRWTSSLNRAQVSPLVPEIVVIGGIAGVDSDAKYNALKLKSVKCDLISYSKFSKPRTRRSSSIAIRLMV